MIQDKCPGCGKIVYHVCFDGVMRLCNLVCGGSSRLFNIQLGKHISFDGWAFVPHTCEVPKDMKKDQDFGK